MIEKPSAGRAKIQNNFNGLQIEIPVKKNWFVIIFATVWMGGWVMGEVFALSTLLSSDSPTGVDLFLLVWVTGWTIGGAFVLYMIAWILMGKEKIELHNGILSLERSVHGIGRKKKYDIQSIKSLALNPQPEYSGWGGRRNRNTFGLTGGTLKFDYGMKTVKFAGNIDEAEAKVLLEKLKANPNLA